MFAKVNVNAFGTSDLWKYLTNKWGQPSTVEVSANWTKFLIDHTGQVVGRYEPNIHPRHFEYKIYDYLQKRLKKDGMYLEKKYKTCL